MSFYLPEIGYGVLQNFPCTKASMAEMWDLLKEFMLLLDDSQVGKGNPMFAGLRFNRAVSAS